MSTHYYCTSHPEHDRRLANRERKRANTNNANRINKFIQTLYFCLFSVFHPSHSRLVFSFSFRLLRQSHCRQDDNPTYIYIYICTQAHNDVITSVQQDIYTILIIILIIFHDRLQRFRTHKIIMVHYIIRSVYRRNDEYYNGSPRIISHRDKSALIRNQQDP